MSLLIFAPRRNPKVAGATPVEADCVDPSALRDVDSADGPVVPDGDDPATPIIPYGAIDPAHARVMPDEVDPAIPDVVAPMCDGDPDDVAPKIPCEYALMIPAPANPRRCCSDGSVSGDSRKN